MKGCYCLTIHLNNTKRIKVGKLGNINFKKGYYVYVGSAMNSLESRIKRHLIDEKKLHWHIDYLLKKTKITCIIYNENKKLNVNYQNSLQQKRKVSRTLDAVTVNVKATYIILKIEMKPLNL